MNLSTIDVVVYFGFLVVLCSLILSYFRLSWRIHNLEKWKRDIDEIAGKAFKFDMDVASAIDRMSKIQENAGALNSNEEKL